MSHEQQALILRGEDGAASVVPDSPDDWKELPKPSGRARTTSLVISFEDEEDRDLMVRALRLRAKKGNGVWSASWPPEDPNLPTLFDA